jgi:hypothetical protein
MTTDLPVNAAYGLDPVRVGANLSTKFVAVHDSWMDIVPVNSAAYSDESGVVYRARYVHGPASLTAVLGVHMETQDPARTPVFRGAWLEAVS